MSKHYLKLLAVSVLLVAPTNYTRICTFYGSQGSSTLRNHDHGTYIFQNGYLPGHPSFGSLPVVMVALSIHCLLGRMRLITRTSVFVATCYFDTMHALDCM
ncbi:hypothetical protein BYT27DRAFT_6362042 [Phlegmacium glaucopus]|nr:hypothetical protein BYT27DRAFT_6362042 [Phlegmacium glaucopus]